MDTAKLEAPFPSARPRANAAKKIAAPTVTKPRKPNPTYLPDGVDVAARLATLQAAIREADEKLEMAFDATEGGDSINTLLEHIAHDLLTGDALAMLEDAPTRADATACHDALFAPLAALEGAIHLAHGSAIEATLREAWKLLDWAQSECEPNRLRNLLPAQSDEDRAFLRGRDIAVALLREARGYVGTDAAAPKRWHRGGKDQENFVYGYLSDILEEPALQRGFSAVLSAAIPADYVTDPEAYEHLPMAEFMAGEIGADGTEIEKTPLRAEAATETEAKPSTRLFHAFSVFECAQAILNERAPALQDDLTYGARSLIRHLHPAFRALCSQKSLDEAKCNPLSVELSVIDGVLLGACTATDDQCLWGVLHLVRESKARVDDLIATLMAVERELA